MLYPNFYDLVSFKRNQAHGYHHAHKRGASLLGGNHLSQFRGQGLEFDAVREYVLNDDIRHIDWRVTARTNKPHMKLFKEERERPVILCVDVRSGMRFGTKNTFKSVQAARIAAFLGWLAIKENDPVGVCLFGDVAGEKVEGLKYFEPVRTKKSFCAALKVLAEPHFPNEKSVNLNEMLVTCAKTIPTGALVYVISDFMDLEEDFKEEIGLKLLKRKCEVVFISVNDRAERSLMPVGELILSAYGSTENRLIDTDNTLGRKKWSEQWEQNRALLKQTARRLKIPLLEMSTESDIRKDLARELKSFNRRQR